jgi:murein DD-endopeptidase
LSRAKAQTSVSCPAVLEVPCAPIPVKALGRIHLVYELHVTNFSRANLTLMGLEVLADDTRATSLASYRGADLLRRLAVIRGSAGPKEENVVGGGQRAIVFLMISTDPLSVPRALHHRLFFNTASAGSGDEERVVEGMGVAVREADPLVITPPLRGRWLAGNGLSNDTNHRRSVFPIDGRARIAQRFATDWVKLGDDGRIARGGDLSQNVNYYGYGAQALAVADAVVVGVKDGIPENVPRAKARAVPMTLETITGNYVLLDIGRGRFALYAHLQPQSLRVQVGDEIKLGQVLGLVGNSGNSGMPHLHFHLVDAASPLAAEGEPYVFDSFLMQGVAKTPAERVKEGFKPDPDAESKRHLEMPIQNAVVVFP